ncbi:hypothetical protein AB0K18_42925 [Nonomuraea sp. NPDC049421]|uniref:hypothetical protein n=1 Tax=Nonomuraea sp. NPDC049421 TaxID=3155275 RepID=UPI003414FE84
MDLDDLFPPKGNFEARMDALAMVADTEVRNLLERAVFALKIGAPTLVEIFLDEAEELVADGQ